MPIPKPKKNEERDEYISRAVSWIMDEDPDLDPENEDDRKQAVAIAFSTWRKAKGLPEPKESHKKLKQQGEDWCAQAGGNWITHEGKHLCVGIKDSSKIPEKIKGTATWGKEYDVEGYDPGEVKLRDFGGKKDLLAALDEEANEKGEAELYDIAYSFAGSDEMGNVVMDDLYDIMKADPDFELTREKKGSYYYFKRKKKAEEGNRPLSILVDRLELTEAVDGIHKVHGFAMHPIITYHPGEPPRRYDKVKEELIKATPTLKGKHFNIDHWNPLDSENVITDVAWNYEQNALEFWGEVDDAVATLINSGLPVSVEIDWLIPGGSVNYVNGIAPSGFEFGDLAILKNLEPGDLNANIELILETISRVLIKGGSKLKKIKEQNGEPTPKEDETKEDFMGRCVVGDRTEEQCNGIWEKHQKPPEASLTEQGELIEPKEDETKEDFMVRCRATERTGEECEVIWGEHQKPTAPLEPPIVEQGMTAEEIKAKITELATRRAEIGEQLYPETELTDEERVALEAEQETIWSEISALEKALAEIIAAQAVAQTLPEGTEFDLAVEFKFKEQEPPEPAEPPEKKPEDYTDKKSCEAAGFHYYDDACHKEPKPAEPAEPPAAESVEIVKLRKQIVDLRAEKADLTKESNKLRQAIDRIDRLTSKSVPLVWGAHYHYLHRNIRNAIKESQSS